MDIDQDIRVTDITARVEEALHADLPIDVVRFAPPSVRLPLPDYVSHRSDVDPIGKAASEAIAIQYAGAMKALEEMGKELIDCVKQSHEMAERCIDAVRFVSETCDLYREDSKAVFARIEHCSALTMEVRKVCDEMRRKIHHDNKPEREHFGHSNPGQDEAAADQPARLSDAVVRGDLAQR